MTIEPIGMNFHYISGEPKEYFLKNKTPLPASYAMHWCMTSMGVHRIFSREDMREFLFRMAIALHSTKLVETWFLKDHLMEYSVGDGKYTFTLENIVMHFGFESIDAYFNLSDRKSFYPRLANGIINAAVIGKHENFTVIGAERDAMGEIQLTRKNPAPGVITEKMIANAEFFADDLMKFIPEEIFENKPEEMRKKEEELKERREKIENLPVFDINQVPHDIIKKCAETMYIEEYAEEAVNDPVLFEKEIAPFIYLGWLFHNNLLERDVDFMLQPVEGVPFDYEKYFLEKNAYNLDVTIGEHEIENMEPYLKDLFFNTQK